MSKRLKERVQTGVNDQQKPIYKWAAGYSTAELQLDIARILVEAGMIEGVTPQQQETKPANENQALNKKQGRFSKTKKCALNKPRHL